jgi:hypothetical protein
MRHNCARRRVKRISEPIQQRLSAHVLRARLEQIVEPKEKDDRNRGYHYKNRGHFQTLVVRPRSEVKRSLICKYESVEREGLPAISQQLEGCENQ